MDEVLAAIKELQSENAKLREEIKSEKEQREKESAKNGGSMKIVRLIRG